MSIAPQGPGWWQASDGRWYPPQGPTSPPSRYQVYGAPGFGGSGLPSVQGMAIASLVLGICGIVLCFCSGLISGVLGLIGLPFGIVALRRISAGDADPAPRGLAIAGIACSGIAIALGIVGVVLLVFLFSAGRSVN